VLGEYLIIEGPKYQPCSFIDTPRHSGADARSRTQLAGKSELDIRADPMSVSDGRIEILGHTNIWNDN
jgi:hypothetical protein